MPDKPPIDLQEKMTYNGLCQAPRKSEDTTLEIGLATENMIKRFRQLGSGAFTVIVLDGEPVMVVFSGKVELLRRQ